MLILRYALYVLPHKIDFYLTLNSKVKIDPTINRSPLVHPPKCDVEPAAKRNKEHQNFSPESTSSSNK